MNDKKNLRQRAVWNGRESGEPKGNSLISNDYSIYTILFKALLRDCQLPPLVFNTALRRPGLPQLRSHRKPPAPAVSEAKRMAIWEALIVSGFPAKARLVMKIDIVKPIPLRTPAPKTFRQFRSGGKWQMPLATATKQRNVTPKGLPKIKPAVMPRLFVLDRICIHSAPTKYPYWKVRKSVK